MEDDALVGVKSSALRLGSKAPSAVLIFYGLCVLLVLAAGLAAHMGPLFWPLAALYGLHLAWQARRLKTKDGPLALSLFKSNREAGLILFLAFVAGAWGHSSPLGGLG